MALDQTSVGWREMAFGSNPQLVFPVHIVVFLENSDKGKLASKGVDPVAVSASGIDQMN